MEKALFIVRDCKGKALLSIEKPIRGNMFSDAHRVMAIVQCYRPYDAVKCCEIWTKSDHSYMNLLVTVF